MAVSALYRGLNRIMVKSHPLPLTNTTLNAFAGASYFIKLDLHSVYNLVTFQHLHSNDILWDMLDRWAFAYLFLHPA